MTTLRMDGLFSRVVSIASLRSAFFEELDRSEAIGMDGMRPSEFGNDLERELSRLHEELINGRYRAQPVVRIFVQKPNGGRRALGISAVRDRVLQRSILRALAPIFEERFLDCSHAYRPRRSAQTALHHLLSLRDAGFSWVVESDIEDCFGSVDGPLLQRELEAITGDIQLSHLVMRILQSGVLESGCLRDAYLGLPQGSPLSPLLSNIYLHPFDVELVQAGYPLVRYADDFVVLAHDQKEAEIALQAVQDALALRALRPHPQKTRLSRFQDGISFLGFLIDAQDHRPNPKSIQNLLDRLNEARSSRTKLSPAERFAQNEAILQGWRAYFSHFGDLSLPHPEQALAAASVALRHNEIPTAQRFLKQSASLHEPFFVQRRTELQHKLSQLSPHKGLLSIQRHVPSSTPRRLLPYGPSATHIEALPRTPSPTPPQYPQIDPSFPFDTSPITASNRIHTPSTPSDRTDTLDAIALNRIDTLPPTPSDRTDTLEATALHPLGAHHIALSIHTESMEPPISPLLRPDVSPLEEIEVLRRERLRFPDEPTILFELAEVYWRADQPLIATHLQQIAEALPRSPAFLPMRWRTEGPILRQTHALEDAYFALFSRASHFLTYGVQPDGRLQIIPHDGRFGALQLLSHLRGDAIFGAYLLRPDQRTLFAALEVEPTQRILADAWKDPHERSQASQAACLYILEAVRRLRVWGISPLLQQNGQHGFRLWLFFANPQSTASIKRFWRSLFVFLPPLPTGLSRQSFPESPSERWPHGGRPITLPLGSHPRTGRRTLLLNPEDASIQDVETALHSVRMLDDSALSRVYNAFPNPSQPRPRRKH
ncbi:hypothetical protein L6R29_09205 [Myxococcota bacterium]|nr:hypothetical protein [Myxococcota bacterium]